MTPLPSAGLRRGCAPYQPQPLSPSCTRSPGDPWLPRVPSCNRPAPAVGRVTPDCGAFCRVPAGAKSSSGQSHGVPLSAEFPLLGRRGGASQCGLVPCGRGRTVGSLRCLSVKFPPPHGFPTWGLFFRFGLQVLGAGVVSLTMADPLGVYAAESLSAASAPESAYTALGEVSRQRAAQWRRQHGFEDDRDFAYAFGSYEEARATAGTLVAEAWAAIRASDQAALLGDLARSVEERTPNRRVRRTSTFLMRMAAKGRRVQPRVPRDRPQVQEEAPSEEHIEALSEAFFSLGALKPRGALTLQLEEEWRAALRRRVTAKVGASEKATIRGALLTWSELQVHMADRGREFPPDEVDLDSFLYNGTGAQSRALAGLKWLTKAGGLGYDLGGYSFKQDVHRAPKQAAVLEPPMVKILELAIQQRFEAKDPSWRALLGLWCCGFGVLRFVHVNRSRPMRLSKSTFHFHCIKGKQRTVRSGFDFAVPGFFISGWDWGSRWLAEWKELPSGAQAHSGIAFNEFGVPYTTAQAIKLAQDVFTPALGFGASDLSSYSFRRLGPTYAQLAGWSPESQLALGDWQDKGRVGQQQNSMALHYSSARYTTSVRRKLILCAAVGSLLDFQSWDVIPQSAVIRADNDGNTAMDAELNRDQHTLWQAPARVAEVQPRFHLPPAIPLPLASESRMPRQLNGKRLSAALRDGKTLCAAFQRDRCFGGDDCEDGRHRCAVMLQSGRVCGGTHSASTCHSKRALPAPPSPVKVGARPKSSSVVLLAKSAPTKKSGKASTDVEPKPVAPTKTPKPKKRPQSAQVEELPPLKRAPVADSPSTGSIPEPRTPPRQLVPREPDSPPPSYGASSGGAQPFYAWTDRRRSSDQGAEALFDRLATVNGRRAQAPTRLWTGHGGGELWLAGLPTTENMGAFPPCDIQVNYMQEMVSTRGGAALPGALQLQIALTDPRRRDAQWRECWPVIRQTLYTGGTVVGHCMAGRHRAATGQALVLSLVADVPFGEAQAMVGKLRQVQIYKVLPQNQVGDWIRQVRRNSTTGVVWPTPSGYFFTDRSQIHLKVGDGIPLCRHRQGSAAGQRLRNYTDMETVTEAQGYDRPFCRDCLQRAAAKFHPK